MTENTGNQTLNHEGAWQDDVQIVGHGPSGWAVISKAGAFRFHDECPCIIYSGLSTREAAEVARWDALIGLTDQTHNSPYGPSKVPLSYFNAVGRVLAKLAASGSMSILSARTPVPAPAWPDDPKRRRRSLRS